MTATVAMLSLWRDDVDRRLAERATHLLGKTYPALRWIWVVGDCEDDTETQLRAIAATAAHEDKSVEIVRHDTGIVRRTPDDRFRAAGESMNAALDRVRATDDYVLIHESDLQTSHGVIQQLLKSDRCPIGGWPYLESCGPSFFYDTWAYRRDGVRFTNGPPYHRCYRADEPFEVDSVGSVWMMHAADIRAGVRCDAEGCVDLCRGMRVRGRSIWVDPRVSVMQPTDLWVPYAG